MNGYISDGIARPRRRADSRPRRAVLLLLTIGALLFVGLQSRVAHRIPTRSSEELLTSVGDPVKFPPPEERAMDDECALTAAAEDAVPKPPMLILGDAPSSTSYVGERRFAANLLRAPPVSL